MAPTPLLLLLFLLFPQPSSSKSSVIFSTLGRTQYAFDLFSIPAPPLRGEEVRLTDGRSVNYNGFFYASDLLAAEGKEGVVYVSERNGSSNIYLDVYPSGDARRRATLQLPTCHQIPLLPAGTPISLKDRPSVAGDYLLYISTHEDPRKPRSSWAAVYATHIPTSSTRRLTPPQIADFSPAVSPSGKWTAVASSGNRGWTGEVQELNTDIFVFRTRDGSERTLVVEHGGWPSWADESTLYFHRENKDGWWSIYKANIDVEGGVAASVIERITPPGFHAFTPAAGVGFVVFATRRPDSEFRHIEVLHIESNTLMEVTRDVSPNSHHYNPFVSSDGARIGYHRCRQAKCANLSSYLLQLAKLSGSATERRGSSKKGDKGALLLERIESPSDEISLFRIDGSYPSFSPDGKRIAYVGLPGLYVVNSDGSGKRKLLSGSAFSTAWDLKREGVIYTSYGPTFAKESTEVDVISITLPKEYGGEISVKQLSLGGENNAFPSPSPDGKWVVFRSGRSGYKNLYIMDAVKGEKESLRQLTNGPWTDTMCNWSPDGELIAFASDRDHPGSGSFAVYFIHPNGTGLRKVVQSGEGGRVNHPFFSPDSTHFVFTTDYAGVSAEPISNPHHYQPYGDIYIARIDGTGLMRMTHNSYEDGTPTWGHGSMETFDAIGPGSGGSLCQFEDCHWLGSIVHSNYGAAGCRVHESRG